MWSYSRVEADEKDAGLLLHILTGPSAVVKRSPALITVPSLLNIWTQSLLEANSSDYSISASVKADGLFKLWLCLVSDDGGSTLEETVDLMTDFLHRPNHPSACFTFSIIYPSENEGPQPSLTFLLSILKVKVDQQGQSQSNDHRFAVSNSTANHDCLQSKCSKLWNQRIPWYLFAFSTFVLVSIGIGVAVHPRNTLRGSRDDGNSEFWLNWNTSHSKGLQHQLQFTKPWRSFLDYFNEEKIQQPWFLRLDDQSMVPPHLIDESELKYQEWFRKRYPEMEKIRLNGDYLNESFWENPNLVKVITDPLFHPAHCLLAVRRYWLARESGRHVCPRDIDYHHVKHCLDSLDDVLFIGITEDPVIVLDDPDRKMPWLVNACF